MNQLYQDLQRQGSHSSGLGRRARTGPL